MIERANGADIFPNGAAAGAGAPAAGPARVFRDRGIYKAKVVEQSLYTDYQGMLTLGLVCDLVGEMIDTRNPQSSTAPCQPARVTVSIRFPHDDEGRMEMAVRDLQGLGFNDEDVDKLNPEVKGHFSVVGRDVTVGASYKEYNGVEQLWWNLRTIRQREQNRVEKGSLKKTPAASAYREAIARLREKANEKVMF